MENNIRSIATLKNLLDDDAGKFAITEMQQKKALSSWIHKANSIKLRNMLQKYLEHIEKNTEKLNSFIEEEKISALSLDNKLMSAFVEETESKLAACTDNEVRDACLLACIQSMNHYKISMYGTAAAFATVLGLEKATVIFREAEVNEKQIDDRLSQLAEYEINVKAKTPVLLAG